MKKLFSLFVSLFASAQLSAQSFFASSMTHLRQWQAGSFVSDEAVRQFGIGNCFEAMPIPDKVFARMQGKSYPKGCTVPRAQLRYIKILHVDFNGHIRLGELVCDKSIAGNLVAVFKSLFEQHYPIESVRLIDDYDASDEKSMRANNTSCFCFRVVKGSNKLSKHARGIAVDINPLYNPCVKTVKGKLVVQPGTAVKYANRSARFPHKITQNDAAYKVFINHGFKWGGAWHSLKDYQHFEK